MKKLLYRVFALIFNIAGKARLKENRVVFLAPHKGGGNDSLSVMQRYTESLKKYEVIRISSSPSSIAEALRFLFVSPVKLARAKYIFLNDNFMPMAYLRFSPDAVITQLWHGEGAFKKFGLMTDLKPDVAEIEKKAGEKLTFVICTSEKVKSVYARAFGCGEEKVLPLGSPRADYLLAEHDKAEISERFYAKFPECRGKKAVLYAPTFRDDPEDDRAILSHVDAEKFRSELGDEYCLLVKLHPQVRSSGPLSGATDVTDYDIGELSLICDTLVTDYSSVCMDFALLNKKCVFYAYDLEKYDASRSFCFGYEGYVPGEIAKDFDGFLNAIKNPRSDERLERFRNFNFDYFDTDNARRIADRVFG